MSSLNITTYHILQLTLPSPSSNGAGHRDFSYAIIYVVREAEKPKRQIAITKTPVSRQKTSIQTSIRITLIITQMKQGDVTTGRQY